MQVPYENEKVRKSSSMQIFARSRVYAARRRMRIYGDPFTLPRHCHNRESQNPSEGRHYLRWHLANFAVFSSQSPDEVAYELSNSAQHANWIAPKRAQNDVPALHRREIGIFILHVMQSARYFFAEGKILRRFANRNVTFSRKPEFLSFFSIRAKPDDGEHFSFLLVR